MKNFKTHAVLVSLSSGSAFGFIISFILCGAHLNDNIGFFEEILKVKSKKAANFSLVSMVPIRSLSPMSLTSLKNKTAKKTIIRDREETDLRKKIFAREIS
jgi:hypothetical protein